MLSAPLGGRRLLLDGFPRSRDNAIDFEAQCGRPELAPAPAAGRTRAPHVWHASRLVPQALHLVCDEEKMLERILRRAQTEGRADDTRKAAAPPPNPLLWSLARTLLWTCR